jgi:nitrogen fixation NifU-like protein
MAGLEDLYREIILDHYRSPRNRGELPVPPARKLEGFNPLCGDEIVLYVVVDPETGTVADLRVGGQGCSISQALMSIHESRLEGEVDGDALAAELEGVNLGDLEALQGVVKFPVRIKCATLAWNTLSEGLEEPSLS